MKTFVFDELLEATWVRGNDKTTKVHFSIVLKKKGKRLQSFVITGEDAQKIKEKVSLFLPG